MGTIRVADLETGEFRVLFSSPGEHFPSIGLSPDGSTLVVARKKKRSRAETLWLLPAAGGEPRRIWEAPEGSYFKNTEWTSGGEIVISLRDERGYRLWRLSRDGQALPTELRFDQMESLRLHRDGKRVLFRTGSLRMAVWALEVPGESPEGVTKFDNSRRKTAAVR
jgi:hypothetical protein